MSTDSLLSIKTIQSLFSWASIKGHCIPLGQGSYNSQNLYGERRHGRTPSRPFTRLPLTIPFISKNSLILTNITLDRQLYYF
jgi:hypothetical protein